MQATDRAHRIAHPIVPTYELVGSGTAEEKVFALQDEKRALLTNVFEASDDGAKLSPADLKSLLTQASRCVEFNLQCRQTSFRLAATTYHQLPDVTREHPLFTLFFMVGISPSLQPRPTALTRWLGLRTGLIGVLCVMSGYYVFQSLSLTTVDEQIYAALGCRSDAVLLVLKLQSDGRILWPDAGISTVEESVLLLPSWCGQHQTSALAILADPGALLTQVTPLLDAADQIGIRRAILATPVR